MLDARNVYRKVTRKIYDFSPEQLANLTSIVWLHRGQNARFLELVQSYLERTFEEAKASQGQINVFIGSLDALIGKLPDVDHETKSAFALLGQDIGAFEASIDTETKAWEKSSKDNPGLKASTEKLEPMAETSRDLIKQIELKGLNEEAAQLAA